VETQQHARVAILLPTYNGARFVEAQIRSLTENATPFTLHWLDDHSVDDTRAIVRASALNAGIELSEWHQPQHLGHPGTFFQLIECADSDIYLFCDQDDIWQPGKIDATVANLLPDAAKPVLCFSESFVFKEDNPEILHRVFDLMGTNLDVALQESRLLMFNPCQGNTVGFTRPLRDIFLRHKDVARKFAPTHDWWMYLIAVASGTCRLLSNAPTTLWRLHGNNISAALFGRSRWRLQQAIRRWASRQAEGFCLASATLTPGPKLESLLALARLVATLDRRQSPAALLRLARHGAMPPSRNLAIWLATACLFSNAKE
jgi:glycosyltransferase involved in cell wall biosynthesis